MVSVLFSVDRQLQESSGSHKGTLYAVAVAIRSLVIGLSHAGYLKVHSLPVTYICLDYTKPY